MKRQSEINGLLDNGKRIKVKQEPGLPSEKEGENGSELRDASDRAQSYRKIGTSRIHLDEIGFYPGNRGGMCFDSNHVHTVAYSCHQKKIQVDRYVSVHVVEIPLEHLKYVQDLNFKMCKEDILMPQITLEEARKIRYVCATKTHFTQACKLLRKGNSHFHNDATQGMCILRSNDEEGQEIMKNGPICVIYKEALYDDKDAMQALMSGCDGYIPLA